MFEQIKSKFEHNLSPLVVGPCHKNWNYERRSSQITKTEVTSKGRCEASAVSIISIISLSFLYRAKKKNDATIYQSKKNKRQKSSWEDGPPTSRIFLIYRCERRTALNSKFQHIWRVSLYPRFFGMLDQPDTIRSCHVILSIMKSRFGSLISQLSSPISKEVSECKETFWPHPSDYKRHLNFSNQGLVSMLRSFTLKPGERGSREGICSGQFLSYTRIKTRVPHHQNLPRIPTMKAIRASPHKILFGYSRDRSSSQGINRPEDTLPSENIVDWDQFFRPE